MVSIQPITENISRVNPLSARRFAWVRVPAVDNITTGSDSTVITTSASIVAGWENIGDTWDSIQLISGVPDSVSGLVISGVSSGISFSSLSTAGTSSLYDLYSDGFCTASVDTEVFNWVEFSAKRYHAKRGLCVPQRRRKALELPQSAAELKARESLRDLLTETAWRRYVTNGFIMVQGKSGRFYQIFNNQRNTVVYEKNKAVASICIHTDNTVPPTDHVLSLKLLVELDEESVWKGGNVRKMKAA